MSSVENPQAADDAMLSIDKHHNLPESRGGASHEYNLSSVEPSRHVAFHRDWAENREMGYLIRLLAMASLRLPAGEGRMAPESFNELLEITSMKDWAKLYRPEAVRTVVTPNAMGHAWQVHRWSQTHAAEEFNILSRMVPIIERGWSFKAHVPSILRESMVFFHAKTPLEAIEQLFAEEFKGEKTWVKALQHDTREAILKVVTEGQRRQAPRSLKEYLDPLQKQQDFVSRYLAELMKPLRNPDTRRKRMHGNGKRFPNGNH